MRLSLLLFPILTFYLAINACKSDPDSPTPDIDRDWLIPANQVRDGGPGKDGIPSIDNPVFVSISEAEAFLDGEDLVVGVRQGNTVRAYPHIILDWHEIVNDNIDDHFFSLIYCPLTGSATAWDREHQGKLSSFGVSGLLYNTNIIPYDRETDSNWSQMRLECVNGERSGESPESYQVIETSWATWKNMYPNSEILSTNTGFNRSYGSYPYGGYRTNSQIIFPVENLDERLHAKDRALAVIIDGQAKGYPLSAFETETDETIRVIEETVGGQDLVIVGSVINNIAAAYQRTLPNGTILSFEAAKSGGAAMLRDQEGTEWDAFGVGVSGPRQGERLARVESFTAYWFAWGTFYPDLELYEN